MVRDIFDGVHLYWTKVPPTRYTPEGRECASMSYINNHIYMFGGLSRELHKDTQLYSPELMNWLMPNEYKIRSEPMPRYQHSAVLYYDHIIVFGGN